MDETTITLRTATQGDLEFIASLIETTMRSYVEQIWGSYNRESTRQAVSKAIASSNYAIVRSGGEEVGALCVEREPTHIQLAQIFILPSHQNRGIGTRLIRGLANEAAAAAKPLRVRVLSVNPARRWYEREGFVVTSQTTERFFMERRA